MGQHKDSVEAVTKIATIIHDGKVNGTSANEITRQVLEVTSQQVSDAYTKGRSDEAKTCQGCQGRCEQQVEAITHAIMTAVHKQEERDDTPYPKIRTHTLAGIIKSLVPSFSYHGYIKRMTEREVEEAVRKRNGVIKEYKDEGVMFVLKVEDGKTYEASMPIPKWAEVGKITMRTHNHQD